MTRSYAPAGTRPLLRRALLAVALAGAAQAHALESDRNQPLDVTADRFEGGTQQPISVLTGNVHITQGSIVGTGDKADVHQKDGAVQRVVLTGALATFKQDIEGGGSMSGKARNIDYDVSTKRAVLTGDAIVQHPSGEARGARLSYDVDTGKLSGDGVGGDGRVHLLMRPKPPAEKKPAEKKPDTAATVDPARAPADQASQRA